MATIYYLPTDERLLEAQDLGELAELLECVLDAGDDCDRMRAYDEPGQPGRLLTADEFQAMLVHLVRLAADRR